MLYMSWVFARHSYDDDVVRTQRRQRGFVLVLLQRLSGTMTTMMMLMGNRCPRDDDISRMYKNALFPRRIDRQRHCG